MQYKKKIGVLLSVTLVPIMVVLIVASSCSPKRGCTPAFLDYFLRFDNVFSIITPLSISLFPLLLILLFCRETAYKSWKKFSLWYFGIFAVLLSPIIFTSLFDSAGSGYNGGLMSNPASVDIGEDVLILGLYFILSLIIITLSQIRAVKREGIKKTITPDFKSPEPLFELPKSKMDFSDIELLKQVIISAETTESDEKIKKVLREQGWKAEDIERAFSELGR